MENSEIADVFDQMAELLELSGENMFRIRAYRNGAKAIRELPENVADILTDSARDLKDVPGIGQTLADKSRTLVTTGSLPQLDELRKKIPPGLIKIMHIPGLGAKKAIALHRELGVENLEQLRTACEQHQVRQIKGFGEKTEQSILEGLTIAQSAAQRMRIDQAQTLASRIRAHMTQCASIKRLEFAGSLRRGKETVGDLDMLVISDDPAAVMDHFGQLRGIASVIGRGDTKMSLRVDDQFQVDMLVVPQASFGSALQYFTGSKEHNVAIRQRAKKMGMTVNEYGVAKLSAPGELFAGASEEELYSTLGLQWIPPELREGRHEIQWAGSDHGFPNLVQLRDMQGDLHMHTVASDGTESIEAMAAAAAKRGLKYIAITDHSKRVSMARGLGPERLLAQWAEIDQLNRNPANGPAVRILKGIECDILESGPLDLPDEVLEQADWVVASVHYGQKQSRQEITARIVGALCNPHVDCIAHPTGRLIGRRQPYEVDMSAVIQTAANERKCLELNAHPTRLDLSESFLMSAIAAGVPISINTDAHTIDGMDVMSFGVIQARRAGVLADQVINTWPITRLLSWLERN